MTERELNSEYWNERYKTDDAKWDLGAVSTPLKTYFDTLTNKNIRILIPGAGNCYEGEYLLEKGFTNITVLDYAPEAIESFRKRIKDDSRVKLVCGDFFSHPGEYDLIIEQTFFCALDPSLRKAYANKIRELLAPRGRLVGLLFTSVPNSEGPPFGGSEAEYQQLFSEKFLIEKLEPCYNSIKPREGRELFFSLSGK
jgi:SAM-dependent methyltransferase